MPTLITTTQLTVMQLLLFHVHANEYMYYNTFELSTFALPGNIMLFQF